MADGWARVTDQPQAVIVHTDVGTQSLGAAIHNASAGRCTALIFAGLSPYTEIDELGTRTEYQMWLQDAPDQKAIVREYCRYVGEFRTAATVKQTVARAMQFAKSDPTNPALLRRARLPPQTALRSLREQASSFPRSMMRCSRSRQRVCRGQFTGLTPERSKS